VAQSPESARDAAGGDYAKSWDALGALIAQGKSFSGRERNCAFLNLGAKDMSFACAGGAVNLDQADDSRAVIPADWDGDGDLDLWFSNRTAPRLRFLRNDVAGGGNWLALQLEGRTANRDAIGARVEITLRAADGTTRTLWRRVKAGDGFLSQTPKSLHFGFRADEQVQRAVIHWPAPGLSEQVVADLEANHRWKIVEGRAAMKLETRQLLLAAGAAPLPEEKPEVRAPLVNRPPVPGLNYLDTQGAVQSLEGAHGRPVLVLFWASWCPACAREMQELATRAAEFPGLRILALAVDTAKPAPDKSAAAEVRRALRERAWPFDAGFALPATVRTLALLESRALYPERDLPLPSASLIAPDGTLAVIYHGRMDPQQLAKDAAFAAQPPADMESAVFPFPGRSAKTLFPLHAAGLAQTLREAGYTDEARAELRRLLEAQPKTSTTARVTLLRQLADLEDSAGRFDDAIAAWREAGTLAPSDAALPLALGASLWKARRPDAAAAAFTEAAARHRDAAAFQRRLGKVWQALGEHAKAREAFAASLAAAPDHEETAFHLAVAQQFSGDTAAAIAGYEALWNRNPSLLDAAGNLAWLLATAKDRRLRDPARALHLAQQVNESTAGQSPAVLDNLAAAQAASGDFAAAVRSAAQAVQLARATGEDALAQEAARHLAAYREGKPWIE